MWTAAVEYAILSGVGRYTCISHRQFLSVMLSAGWGAESLGQLQECDGQLIGAILFTIAPATLRECRRRYGYRAPILYALPQTEAA
jgi:N-acyl-L-homoserine lactone synthetase